MTNALYFTPVTVKYLVAGSTPAGREGVRHKEDPLVRRPQNEGPDHPRGGASLSDEPRERRQVRRGEEFYI